MNYLPKQPLEPKDAERVIREIARNGQLMLSKHCRLQSMPQRNITFQDLVTVLLNGAVDRPAEYDQEHNQYKYRVAGETLDEEETVIISVILDHRSLFVVTVF
jgi:hypothetical protein